MAAKPKSEMSTIKKKANVGKELFYQWCPITELSSAAGFLVT